MTYVRPEAGPRAARVLRTTLAVCGVTGLALSVAAGVVVRSEGFTLTTLSFWVGLIVGVTLACAVVSGAWDAGDPWATLERVQVNGKYEGVVVLKELFAPLMTTTVPVQSGSIVSKKAMASTICPSRSRRCHEYVLL